MGLTKGILERWTKGFDCDGVVGENVVSFLTEAIQELGINISVMAILNDTTGTLMSCAWKNSKTFIGLIIGTGSNACYVESIDKAELFDGDRTKPYVIINTEWGAFGDDGTLEPYRTKNDGEADSDSINPGKQMFEKMISGMYLGELVRLYLVDFAEEGLFLPNSKGDWGKLKEKGSILTKHVSVAEKDDGEKYSHVRHIIEHLGMLFSKVLNNICS